MKVSNILLSCMLLSSVASAQNEPIEVDSSYLLLEQGPFIQPNTDVDPIESPSDSTSEIDTVKFIREFNSCPACGMG